MENRGQHLDGEDGRRVHGGDEHQLIGLGEDGNIHLGCVVERGGEGEAPHHLAHGREKRLARLLIGRRGGQTELEETVLVLVGREQLKHGAVLVVIVGVHRRRHKTGRDAVQPDLIHHRHAQLGIVDGDGVFHFAVDLVICHRSIGLVLLEQRLGIVRVGVSHDPRKGDFLGCRAEVEARALENCQRRLPGLGTSDGVADALDQKIGELIAQIGRVRRPKRALGLLQRGDHRIGDALLVVVGTLQPRARENCAVVNCHAFTS